MSRHLGESSWPPWLPYQRQRQLRRVAPCHQPEHRRNLDVSSRRAASQELQMRSSALLLAPLLEKPRLPQAAERPQWQRERQRERQRQRQ